MPEGAGPPERHLLKVIRLNSARIPTPVLPVGVHIDRIADVSFFGWTPDGALCLPGRSQIPPLQVLHLESRAPDRAQAFAGTTDVLPQLAEKYGDSAANSRDERIAALADAVDRELHPDHDPHARNAFDDADAAPQA